MTPLLVVHGLADTGDAWRAAIGAWPGEASAPDLVLEGASGDRTDVVWLLLEQMEAWRARGPVVVGCGEHGLAAETFALAGWAGRLVLVDGLGGAWTTPDQQVDAQNEWLRAKLADPELMAYPQVWFEPFYVALRANVHCPALVVETPASITPDGEAERRVRQFAGPADLVHLKSSDPVAVLAAVGEWAGS